MSTGHLFAGTALIVIFVCSMFAWNMYRLVEEYETSSRSEHKVAELEGLLADIINIETRVRGYALTRDPEFLDSYGAVRANLRQRSARLRTLTRDGELDGAYAEIEKGAGERMALSEDLRQLASTGASHEEVARQAIRGKTTTDRIRHKLTPIIATLKSRSEGQRSQLGQDVRTTAIVVVGVIGAALVVLACLFKSLSSEIMRRRRAETELRELTLELEDRVQERTTEVRHARDLFKNVVENLPDMIFLKDPADEFRYALVNAAGEKLLGHDRDEILGRNDLDLLPREEAEVFLRDSKEVVEAGKPRKFPDRSITTPAGTRTIETRKVPIANIDGSPPLVLGIVRDVTDLRTMEEEVRQLQRVDVMGRLTGGVAHDFNNLLAVIMGSVELISEQVPKDSEAATLADEALDAVRRGADLVRRLLAFARKQHLEPTVVDLNDRLDSLLSLLRRTLGENIQIQINSGVDLWRARIDPTQVDDALINLSVNARDAMPNGGTLTIETANVVLDEEYASQHAEVEPGDYVMLAVSDTGAGMAADVAARAFEPFFSTKPEGKGSGLGLSQVFGWVKQSNGHIKIYSELGHGTTIKLYLPRAVNPDQQAEKIEAQEERTSGDETILLVEDNPSVRRTVVRQLTDLGYSVIEAGDGESGLDIVRSGIGFDLLLTDVVMPGGMSGYELAAAAEEVRPGIKVLFTSGYTELAATGLQIARTGPLISKPYSKRALGQAIRSALEGGEPATG